MQSVLYSIIFCLLFAMPSLAAQPGNRINYPNCMDAPPSESDLPTLQKKAEQGDALAQLRLGEFLIQEFCTNGAINDRKKADTGLAWLEKSAAQGNPDAAFILGAVYSDDALFFHKKENLEKSVGLLELAIKNGSSVKVLLNDSHRLLLLETLIKNGEQARAYAWILWWENAFPTNQELSRALAGYSKKISEADKAKGKTESAAWLANGFPSVAVEEAK